MMESAPIDLLGDDEDRPRYRLLVIGCGNVLRGDDAAGPVLVRRLWERGGLGDFAALADGGTSGMDVVFKMRDADRVLIVDASRTGSAPGTVFRVPGEEVAEVPPLSQFGSHDFRWDNAIALGHWMLGARMPKEIAVYLIEGERFDFGGELSEAVDKAIDRVADLIVAEAAETAQIVQVARVAGAAGAADAAGAAGAAGATETAQIVQVTQQ